ncbi:OmpA family protein [Marinomonas colpomeniae]|uniref:OmpA family protein n=1 Tax=Marinomonas colpomeniae TaxID=2774408 RepID=A0ABR8P218_9GAMM|nr:OmpA family protein [Marinomonas colpomeniae]MBD5771834.1 OmpA family protein [Marinomonas colpomeniae]
MKTIIKTISLVGILFSFSHLVLAESLYSENLQARLVDLDKDGVIDARDLCSDTPRGAAVDNNGCPNQSTKLLSLELNVLFDSGKSTISPVFYSELKELATFLQDHPDSSVIIEGHTDNKGSDALNRSLSQKRAVAIANVLVDNFRIKADRVEGVGYGESRPIDTNDTEEGRAKNRRVVAEVIAKQAIRKQRWTIYTVDTQSNTALSKY